MPEIPRPAGRTTIPAAHPSQACKLLPFFDSRGMVQAPQRTALSGPSLIRLLARLADADVPESGQSLSDRLSQWLGWTDAISLSSALNGGPPAVAPAARASGSDVERMCADVRASLANAIVGGRASADGRRGSAARRPVYRQAPEEVPADFAVFRQRCLSMQQTMETDIGHLRGRLRVMLAGRTPAMARLASVDAIMERVLGARERSLLAVVPTLLEAHFTRLRDAGRDTPDDVRNPEDAVAPGPWLDAFRNDMQSVMLAELDVRFQSVEGLLAALRAS